MGRRGSESESELGMPLGILAEDLPGIGIGRVVVGLLDDLAVLLDIQMVDLPGNLAAAVLDSLDLEVVASDDFGLDIPTVVRPGSLVVVLADRLLLAMVRLDTRAAVDLDRIAALGYCPDTADLVDLDRGSQIPSASQKADAAVRRAGSLRLVDALLGAHQSQSAAARSDSDGDGGAT